MAVPLGDPVYTLATCDGEHAPGVERGASARSVVEHGQRPDVLVRSRRPAERGDPVRYAACGLGQEQRARVPSVAHSQPVDLSRWGRGDRDRADRNPKQPGPSTEALLPLVSLPRRARTVSESGRWSSAGQNSRERSPATGHATHAVELQACMQLSCCVRRGQRADAAGTCSPAGKTGVSQRAASPGRSAPRAGG